jgi:hypothetical protein
MSLLAFCYCSNRHIDLAEGQGLQLPSCSQSFNPTSGLHGLLGLLASKLNCWAQGSLCVYCWCKHTSTFAVTLCFHGLCLVLTLLLQAHPSGVMRSRAAALAGACV